MKHKHAELIKAWADGAEIEFKNDFGEWEDTKLNFCWYLDTEYRIKQDIIQTTHITISENETVCVHNFRMHNVKFIFDSQTKELKSAEII